MKSIKKFGKPNFFIVSMCLLEFLHVYKALLPRLGGIIYIFSVAYFFITKSLKCLLRGDIFNPTSSDIYTSWNIQL